MELRGGLVVWHLAERYCLRCMPTFFICGMQMGPIGVHDASGRSKVPVTVEVRLQRDEDLLVDCGDHGVGISA